MEKFQIEFYTTEKGEKPAKEFIDRLDKKMAAKVLFALSALQEYGNELREPYSKHISDGIFELRAKFGSDITRVLYFFYYNHTIVITNGFVKKQDKTPLKEVLKAKKYRLDYKARRG